MDAGSGSAAQWARALRDLWHAAGKPTASAITRQAAAQEPPIKVTSSSLSDWKDGKNVPSNARVARWLVGHLRRQAREKTPEFTAPPEGWWEDLRRRAVAESAAKRRNGGRRASEPSGRDWPADPAAPVGSDADLRALPRKSPVFEGRDRELAELLDLLRPGEDDGRTTDSPAHSRTREPGRPPEPTVAKVTGLPGAGKTELAVQAAHAALDAGWFPGGVLFIDVQGYDPERPMTADAALDHLLRLLGADTEQVPPGDYKARLLTSVLAKHAAAGKAVLVVIDNVAATEVAEALIPAVGATLVTSRHGLSSVRGRRIDLAELTEPAAVAMLDGELGIAHADDIRVPDQPEAARSIVRLCGRLPLALHIIAALLAEDPDRPLDSMADDLREADTPLDEMRYREDTTGARGVRAAFELSHKQLSPEQIRILRLLPINPGPDISTEAVAAMADLDVRRTKQRLEELRNAHLIQTASPYGRHGRWKMHDLIRDYVSGTKAPVEELQKAFFLLLLHYYEHSQAAGSLLEPSGRRTADAPFADRGQALTWLDTEYLNLIPYGDWLLIGPEFAKTVTMDLILGLWRYFEIRRRTDDWIDYTTSALKMARVLEDRPREAEALTTLGNALRQARRYDEAIADCHAAIGIQRDLGDRRGEGTALNNLSAALIEAKRHDEAATAAREAFAIFQQTGDRRREGIALSNLGAALTRSGQQAEGIAAYEEASRISREIGDPRFEGATLLNLGHALQRSGTAAADTVADFYRRAEAAMVAAHDSHGKGAALTNLTSALVATEDFDEAIAMARDAVTLLREAKDDHGHGTALLNLGTALLKAGRAAEAVEAQTEAVACYHRVGDDEAELEARHRLGGALVEAGDADAAVTLMQETVQRCRAAADGEAEAEALIDLGFALQAAKRREEAIATLRAAAKAAHPAGIREVEAKAWCMLGSALALDHLDEAVDALRKGLRLYQTVGNAKLAEMAAETLRVIETGRQAVNELNARLAAGRFEEVISEYRSPADEGDPLRSLAAGHTAARLGPALRRAGRAAQAIPILEEAVAAFQAADEPDRERAARAELDAARQAELDAQAAAVVLGRTLRAAEAAAAGVGETAAAHHRPTTAAITEAVRHLGPHDARFLRLLAAAPGPDISLRAAAILAVSDRDVIRDRLAELSALATKRTHTMLARRITAAYRADLVIARGCLRVLTRMRLVEQDLADPSRWRLPAAVRILVAEQSHKDQDRQAQEKLLSLYYLASAHVAAAPLDSGVFGPSHQERQASNVGWLTTEYDNLVAVVRGAGDDDLGTIVALDLTLALSALLQLSRRTDDALQLGAIARRAARRLDDRHAEAVVLRALGGHLLMALRADEAVTTMREALARYQELDDRHGAATMMTNLGSALHLAERFDEAEEQLRTAVDIHHESGRTFSEGLALSGLGALLERTDRLEEAVTVLQAADRLYRKAGDQHQRAVALLELAAVLRRLGREDEAVQTYQRAEALARLTGDTPLLDLAHGARNSDAD